MIGYLTTLLRDPQITQLLYIALGWVLGIGSYLIIEWIKSGREARALFNVLRIELEELSYRLTYVVFRLDCKLGALSYKRLDWTIHHIEKYKGYFSDRESLLKFCRMLRALPEDQINRQLGAFEDDGKSSVMLKKYATPTLDANIGKLGLLDARKLGLLLTINVHHNLFGDAVDQHQYYHQLSFQSGLSSVNHRINEVNIADTYKLASGQAILIIELIDKVLT